MKGGEVLHVRGLGHLAVLRDCTRVQLPRSKKTRALFSYLAVTTRPHSRDRLCSMFWALPDDPRAALRWSLSRLRPLVDEHDCRRIIADRETIGLDLGGVDVDILHLRNLVLNGTDSISTDALRQAAVALEGDFLESLDLPDCREFQNWCIGQREETRRLRARLLTELIARLENAPEEALHYARTLSLIEPADEVAQAAVVRFLRAAGRWRDAEEEFQRSQQRLDDLNVVRTGALRQAAQLPLRAGVPTNAHDGKATPPPAQRQHALTASHEVKFCRTSDGVRIAYAVFGDGPPLVWAAHWLSHLAFSWKSPIWRHWTEEFGKDYSFVHYDERGHGLSDWDVPEFSIDAFVRDLEAVVDTLGLERFALMGSSTGGPVSIAYAAHHPERVSHLILYATVAQGWRKRSLSAAEIELNEAVITLIRHGWAQDNPAIPQILTSLFLPDATPEETLCFNEFQPFTSSAENAVRLLQSFADFDVLDLLPGITAPTLVLHCRDDAAPPFEQGRLIASRIPGARFVALESGNHVLLPRDPAWANFVSEVHRFLQDGGRRPSRPPSGSAVQR
jgi:pimeloyl-ACP methyl ester carboxylesterase/DNA-binding SARP family transcriptional activator